MDVLHISVLDADTAFSGYFPIPYSGQFKDRYLIVDFDRDRRVVGYTAEGLLEDYRRVSWKNRVSVDLGLIGLQHVSSHAVEKVLEFLKDQIPALDARGQLPGYTFA